MKKQQNDFCVGICLIAAFLLWTAAVRFVDVQAIGPRGSTVGFAALNRFVHTCTGVHMSLYTVTDWLGLVPLGFMAGFALLGLVQWIQRKHLRKVDHSILVLGGFCMLLMAVYVLFEAVVVNYRPVLIAGVLEASYPSSTTLLVMCVMPVSAMQINARIRNNVFRRCAVSTMTVFSVFTVIGRLLSGVHWVTDIIGGVLLSVGLVRMYCAVVSLKDKS